MSYNSAQIRKLVWSLSNRLRGVATPDELYPLVYLARTALDAGKTGDASEAIEAASQGDGDIAALLSLDEPDFSKDQRHHPTEKRDCH